MHSVCTTWLVRDKQVYLLHVFRKQLEYPDLKRAVASQAQRFNPDVILVEDKASGIQLIQELRAEGVQGIQGVVPTVDKATRMMAQTPMIESGQVLLPLDEHWVTHYVAELTTFPENKYSDQVDSTSQALEWINKEAWGPGMGTYYYFQQEYRKLHGGP